MPNAGNLIPQKQGTTKRRMNAQRLARLIALLMRSPQTMVEIGRALDMNSGSTWEYFHALREVHPRILRVAEWRETVTRQGIRYVAAYQLGAGADARRPPKKNSTERTREYRARKKMRPLQSLLCAPLSAKSASTEETT